MSITVCKLSDLTEGVGAAALLPENRQVALFRVNTDDGEQVFAVVDAAFAQRRKTLRKALARLAGGADAAESALRAADIDPTRRGETLDITAFAALAEVLQPVVADETAAPTPPTSQEQS